LADTNTLAYFDKGKLNKSLIVYRLYISRANTRLDFKTLAIANTLAYFDKGKLNKSLIVYRLSAKKTLDLTAKTLAHTKPLAYVTV
jgi:hypothetical protein